MTTLGELRIVPSANLGNLGPRQGQASFYQWRWYDLAVGFLPWLVLIGAVIGIEANRRAHVLLIFVPLAVVNLLYLSSKALSSMASSSAVQFDVLFQSLALGLTLLWLVAPALKGHGFIRVATAFGSVMAVAALCMISYGTTSAEETTVFAVVLGTMGAVLILAPIAARRFCRGFYHPARFALWLGFWTVIGGVLAMLGALVILLVILPSGPSGSQIPMILLMTMLAGVGVGSCLYIVQLPFVLLGFASSFFRHRLQGCLHLQPPGPDAGRHGPPETPDTLLRSDALV